MNEITDKRTVLIVAYNFPPRAERYGLRTANIARNLLDHGWKPVVLTCAPDGTCNRNEGWAAELEEAGVEIYRTKPFKRIPAQPDGSVKVPSPRVTSMKRWFAQWNRQPDIYIAWRNEALRMSEQIMRDHYINVILGVAPPFSDFTLAQEIATNYAIPYTIDYGDIWNENPLHAYPTPAHQRKVKAMEEHLLKQAAMVFVPTRTTKEDLLRRHRFLTHEEITIVPHGYDVREYNTSVQPNKTNGCVLTHYADFTNGETPKHMFTALKNLRAKREDIRNQLHIRIVGLLRERHKKLIRKWQLHDVVHHFPTTERATAVHLCLESDALWLCLQHDTPAGHPVLSDYIAMRKPVLLTAPRGALHKVVTDSQAGFVSEPKDVATITQHLEKIFDAWKSNALPKPQEQFAEQFNCVNGVKDVSRHLGMSMRL